jgi:hypothetical protein
LKKLPDHLVLIGLRFEKVVSTFLQAVDGKDVGVLLDAINAYGHVLKEIEGLPPTDDRIALTKFLQGRGNVPEGITDRVLAEVDRLDRDFDRPMPSKSRN